MHRLQCGKIDKLPVIIVAELHPAGLLVGVEHRLVDRDVGKLRLVFFFLRVLRLGEVRASQMKAADRSQTKTDGRRPLSMRRCPDLLIRVAELIIDVCGTMVFS